MIDAARLVADEVLFPTAQDVDRAALVPTSNLDALAGAGLFSLVDLTPTESRRVMATIAGGCGATFFVWAQHHGVVRTVLGSSNDALRDSMLPDLLAGRSVAGVAFAHVRRPDRIAVFATRVEGGWMLDGFAPWATSWGIAEWFCVAAETDGGEMVWAMLPGTGAHGMAATPLSLPVFTSTGTVAFTFSSCFVPDVDVIAIDDVAGWRAMDRRRASVGAPAVLGVAERGVRLLRDAARGDDDPAVATAARLDDELVELWERDDAFVAALATGDDVVAEASDHRAACLSFGQRATTALLAAVGGGGMDLSHPAQRLAREAMFYVIQAQTNDGRGSTLNAQ